MKNSDLILPASVSHINSNGKNVYLVGTAHVSKKSVEDVRNTIEAVRPDTVCVELCAARHKAIVQRNDWKQMNIFKVIKEKKALFLLAQLILSSFYRMIGKQLGVQPGAEIIEGILRAEKNGSELVLADRDVEITLKRVWGHLNLWNRLKMAAQILAGLLFVEKIDENMIEDIKKKDQLETILETFTRSFPEVKKRLIDERDIYLAQKIRNAPGTTIVAVVGAGHVPGIKQHIHGHMALEPLIEIPPKSVIPAILKWAIPVLIAALLVAGFFKGGTQHGIESIYIWILVNGVLAALGAAIALAHPLTILASFIGAPLTSLNPMIAAGWVAGLVQAWVKKPTVSDFEELPTAITSLKGFWTNPVCKILLVVVMANLGSSLGTFISGGWITARMF
jgi:pheromone shutdown-related protein TraB